MMMGLELTYTVTVRPMPVASSTVKVHFPAACAVMLKVFAAELEAATLAMPAGLHAVAVNVPP
jgi:hypothetical protein